MVRTVLPTGQMLRLQPHAVDMAVKPEDFLPPHSCGEDTRAVWDEIGYGESESAGMIAAGIVAGR